MRVTRSVSLACMAPEFYISNLTDCLNKSVKGFLEVPIQLVQVPACCTK